MAGRASKYTPETVQAITEALRLGDSRALACKKAGISDETFRLWLNNNLEFLDAVKKAEKEYRDWEHSGILDSAKKSLRVLIEGQSYDELRVEYERNPSNPNEVVVKRQVKVKKKILPNVTAVIFALTNRDPENWKNRLSGDLVQKVEVDEKTNVSLANVPDELLKQVIESITGR